MVVLRVFNFREQDEAGMGKTPRPLLSSAQTSVPRSSITDGRAWVVGPSAWACWKLGLACLTSGGDLSVFPGSRDRSLLSAETRQWDVSLLEMKKEHELVSPCLQTVPLLRFMTLSESFPQNLLFFLPSHTSGPPQSPSSYKEEHYRPC